MCGITGLCRTGGGAVGVELERMNAEISHRGPDDEGYYRDGGIGLAMRRLSIIDLPGGHQPLANEDESVWVVFNGEIYNYESVRADLVARGHRFRTNGDTETIVHAYEEYGEDCVNRFNGMFAFAIWDRRRRRVFIARDRMGIKPLYYSWDGATLAFGSEIKSILASGAVKKEVDEQSLWHYLTLRYVPAPRSIWQGIEKLPPGHRMTLDLDSRDLRIERWWDIDYTAESEPTSDADVLEKFSSLLLDATRLRLIADVPVGLFLSGGLDSSAVAAAVRETHNAPLKTFSIGFEGGGEYSELHHAREVAEHFGTDHHEVTIARDDFVDLMPDLVWHTDEPLADPASVPLYHVSRLAAKHVKVVLSGEGADEVLAGYTFDQQVETWDRLERFHRLPRVARGRVPQGILAAVGRHELAERLRVRNIPIAQRNATVLPYMLKYFDETDKHALWPSAQRLTGTDEVIRGYYQRSRTASPLQQMLYAYCQDWLVEDLLMKADKMTMATSLELRVPFLDYRLVSWLASLPPEQMVRRAGPDNRYQTKYLLRQFAASRIPASILERPKQGFPVPIKEWFAGPLRNKARDLVMDRNSWVASLFDREALRTLFDATPSPLNSQRIWMLYVLEHWARRWM